VENPERINISGNRDSKDQEIGIQRIGNPEGKRSNTFRHWKAQNHERKRKRPGYRLWSYEEWSCGPGEIPGG
jgi:hypothetical protein